MGIARADESERAEIEEFRRMLLSCATAAVVHRRKEQDSDDGNNNNKPGRGGRKPFAGEEDGGGMRLVCVTSGVSFVGIAVVNQLLLRGYSVRAVVHNEEDVEKVKEMQRMRSGNENNVVEGVVVGNLNDLENLLAAFRGCAAVFHTSSFVDPAGVSGYTKTMAEIEVKATKTVLEACKMTPSVRHCLLTSSLLACVWQQTSSTDHTSLLIDHNSWSSESLCIEKKLWYALGKLRAEKAAWEFPRERGLKLATICPGLITGPEFHTRNSTSTIAYLKGAGEMYRNRVLATVDVNRLAKAHVNVYEEIKQSGEGGRYICFHEKIDSQQGINKFARETGIEVNVESEEDGSNDNPARFQLSNLKLSELMYRTTRCNH